MTTKEQELRAALECCAALDMPTEKGWAILERHGWSRDDRFELNATEFVRRMRENALTTQVVAGQLSDGTDSHIGEGKTPYEAVQDAQEQSKQRTSYGAMS